MAFTTRVTTAGVPRGRATIRLAAAAGAAPTRREFLRATAVAAAGILLGCDAGPAAGDGGEVDGGPGDGGEPRDLTTLPDLTRPVVPPEMVAESGEFSLGVASGDATSTEAVVWTRYSGSSPLRAVIWEMRGEVYARQAGEVDVSPAEGGFVHVDVEGLAAGERYRYAFFEMDGDARRARSPVGRFRAAIAADALVPLVLGACSCTDNDKKMDTLERAGERQDLDAFLLVGDTTYNDSARTLSEYRALWAKNLSTTGYRKLRAAASVLATWDDHEVVNDWDPEKADPARVAVARRVFFENLPLRRDGANPDRIWKRIRWGRTLEVFVLDCRGERRPSTRNTDKAEYISREQMDWLKAGLADSRARFKVIVNSVPIGDFGILFAIAAADRWAGYAAQRTEILAHIDQQRIGGVLWVSGDFHLASMGRVSRDPPGAAQIEVLVGPGAQDGNPLANTLGKPLFDWSSNVNNYTALHFNPMNGEVRVVYHDAQGAILTERTYSP